jgi:hypothetical protein
VTADLNGDGTVEELGACFEGGVEAFGICGTADSGICAAGAQCVALSASATSGVCIPGCDNPGAACADVPGATCALQLQSSGGADSGYGCAIQCSADADCDAPLSCFKPAGQTTGFCVEQ